MGKEDKRLFSQLMTQSQVDVHNNLSFAEFQIVDEKCTSRGRHDFMYSPDGDLKKWIFTDTSQSPDRLVKEENETVFKFDGMGRLVERKRIIRTYNMDGSTEEENTYWYKHVEGFAERESLKKFLQAEDDEVYIITRTDDIVYTPAAEKRIFFLIVHTEGDMRYESYVLPIGVLSFRKQYKWNSQKPDEKKELRYLSPAGGTFHWRIYNVEGESDIAIALYDIPLTLKVYKEIVQYCKTVRPFLDFITFGPEGFIVDEHEQIGAYAEISGVRYGCS